MLNGAYAYHFSGYAMNENVSYHIVGIGSMTLQDGTITGGEQSSSITRLSGSNARIVNARFSLSGTYVAQATGIQKATLHFTEQSGPGPDPQVLTSEFDLIPAGGQDRFWFISTKTINNSLDGAEADEVISGEAILTPA